MCLLYMALPKKCYAKGRRRCKFLHAVYNDVIMNVNRETLAGAGGLPVWCERIVNRHKGVTSSFTVNEPDMTLEALWLASAAGESVRVAHCSGSTQYTLSESNRPRVAW